MIVTEEEHDVSISNIDNKKKIFKEYLKKNIRVGVE